MIATEGIVSKKKLKIKFTTKRIEDEPRSSEFGLQLSGNDCGLGTSDSIKVFATEYSKTKSCMPGAKKRGPPGVIEDQANKRHKMDRRMTRQCSAVLKQLLTHPAAWPFKEPVDPVRLDIPDYFSVISEPMDLGTIRSKLNKNMYLGSEEFVADVRLTFSNAMTYNPPDNHIHNYARKLSNVFEARWKCPEEKLNHGSSKVGQGKVSGSQRNENHNARRDCPKSHILPNNFLPKGPASSAEKVIRSSFESRAADVDLAKPMQKCARKSEKIFHKGTDSDNRRFCGSKCGMCGNNTCQCSFPVDSTHASSERSLGRDHHACNADISKVDCQLKSSSISQESKSDPDSDGAVSAVSALEDEIMCPSSQLRTSATEAASREVWKTPLLDVQLSPKKALRAAILKRRFADTILKAQQKTLLDHGDKADPVKMQQERERLERRQREEKARIEAQIRAAEAAFRTRAEIELKRQREREREAARIALQKMEKTVEIDHDLKILKELEMLCSQSYQLVDSEDGSEVEMGAFEGARCGSPLERLGLFIKDDYLADEDEEAILSGDGEEGEIF